MLTSALQELYKSKILNVKSIYKLVLSIKTEGVNLMGLLLFASTLNGEKKALCDELEEITYTGLFLQAKKMSSNFKNNYKISHKQKIAVMCKNHISMMKVIFALSNLGVDIYLINSEISCLQFEQLNNLHGFNHIICDDDCRFFLTRITGYKCCELTGTAVKIFVYSLLHQPCNITNSSYFKYGKIVVLTSGTGGRYKTAGRKQSAINNLIPVLNIASKINLSKYNSVFIAAPVYHGYGLAALFISIFFGKEIFITNSFYAQSVSNTILQNNIKAMVVVPAMLQRMLAYHEQLYSLQMIISGGDNLCIKTINETCSKLGNDILFNLYGTSEAGFCIMATPSDLINHPDTIGKKLCGVKIKIKKPVSNENIGKILIKSIWTIRKNNWIDTGDVGFINQQGYCFLKGRIDGMIVSGGENVYPSFTKNILLQHPAVTDVAIAVIPDADFGMRFNAIIVINKTIHITGEEIKQWLRLRVARFEMPKQIQIVSAISHIAQKKKFESLK